MLSFSYDFSFFGWLVIGLVIAVAGFAVYVLAVATRGAQKIVAEADEAHQGEVVQPTVDPRG